MPAAGGGGSCSEVLIVDAQEINLPLTLNIRDFKVPRKKHI